MPNRRQFIRQRAAALLAFGLITSLLPSLAAAQDLSTLEKRAAWLTGQFRGAPIGSNAKFGATAALARLALNPDDAEVISYITHFYGNVPEGSNAEQFTYSGVAWVLGKYWDKFTPARAQLMAAARMNLLGVMRSLYDYGYVENLSTTYAAVSNWRPPAAIHSLARGQTVPYELTASARGWIAYWGVGDPGKLMGLPGECVRYVYRDKLYAMGSGFFQYNPRQYNMDYNAFGIIYTSSDPYSYIECYHPYWRSNDRTWKGINSPFMQWAQHKGTAIALFDIPVADPWAGLGTSGWWAERDGHFKNLIQEALVRYPKSIDQKTEADGWIFLREGDVYIAIRPLKAYTIDANYKQDGAFDVVRSAFARTGFVFDNLYVDDIKEKRAAT